jgi:predicted ester cyclase
MNGPSAFRRGLVVVGFVAVAAACSEPPPPPPPPAPPVKTAAERVQLYTDCWGLFNDKAWDRFQNCYTDDATAESVGSAQPMLRGKAAIIEHDKQDVASFPDAKGELRYVFQHGPHVVGIAVYTGTNDGPMPGPDGKPMPATHKKFGLLMGHMVELDAMGAHAMKDEGYLDEGTLMAHLGMSKAPARPVMAPTGAPTVVAISSGDDKEAKNVAAMQAGYDAINKHDLKALDAMMTADYKAIDITRPADQDRKANLEALKEYLTAFPDLKITPATLFGAGDYVVAMGTFEGTNNGNMPSMGVKKTGKKVNVRFLEVFQLDSGKIKNDWLFFDGAGFAAQLGLK